MEGEREGWTYNASLFITSTDFGVSWFESHPRQLIFIWKSDCLGCALLLCFVVCMTLLVSFFFSLLHLSLTCTCIYCLGCAVLLCLVVCLTLLASFFLPSYSSLINLYIHVHVHVHVHTCIYMNTSSTSHSLLCLNTLERSHIVTGDVSLSPSPQRPG